MIGASDIRRVSDTERQARQQAEADAWPDGVTHRYANQVGATVDISETSGGYTQSTCTGCPYGWTGERHDVHDRAQQHTETCRALPRPGA